MTANLWTIQNNSELSPGLAGSAMAGCGLSRCMSQFVRPGMIKSAPGKIITDGTSWRFLNELTCELKG
jgi:hypothetical protein